MCVYVHRWLIANTNASKTKSAPIHTTMPLNTTWTHLMRRFVLFTKKKKYIFLDLCCLCSIVSDPVCATPHACTFFEILISILLNADFRRRSKRHSQCIKRPFETGPRSCPTSHQLITNLLFIKVCICAVCRRSRISNHIDSSRTSDTNNGTDQIHSCPKSWHRLNLMTFKTTIQVVTSVSIRFESDSANAKRNVTRPNINLKKRNRCNFVKFL